MMSSGGRLVSSTWQPVPAGAASFPTTSSANRAGNRQNNRENRRLAGHPNNRHHGRHHPPPRPSSVHDCCWTSRPATSLGAPTTTTRDDGGKCRVDHDYEDDDARYSVRRPSSVAGTTRMDSYLFPTSPEVADDGAPLHRTWLPPPPPSRTSFHSSSLSPSSSSATSESSLSSSAGLCGGGGGRPSLAPPPVVRYKQSSRLRNGGNGRTATAGTAGGYLFRRSSPSTMTSNFCDNKLPWCQICGGLCAFLLALQVVVVACGLFVWPASLSSSSSLGGTDLTSSSSSSSLLPAASVGTVGVLRRIGSDGDGDGLTIMVGGGGTSGLGPDFLERNGVTYRSKAANICSQDPIYFVIAVHSHPGSFMRRNTIRNTWGSVKKVDEWNIRLVFVLGETSGDEKLDLLVQSESAVFNDLVQANFEDTYRNLTIKHLLTYKWASTYCRNAKFLLKADEDVFIDVFQLFRYIHDNVGPEPTRTIACSVNPAGNPVQRGRGKWSVTRQEYPADTYPAYCAGLAYLVTTDSARDIYAAAGRARRFLWIDDVYVTGVLPAAAGVPAASRVSLNLRFTMDRRQLAYWLRKGPAGVPPPYFVTHVDLDEADWDKFIYAAWKKLLRNKT